MKIAFVLGTFSGANMGLVDPDDLYTRVGLTGSESYFFNTARDLAERHDVTAFFTTKRETIWSQVKCRPLATMNLTGFDAVISWNEPDYLRFALPKALRVCCQQLNDFDYCQEGCLEHVDVLVSPSRAHAEHFHRNYGVPVEAQEVLPNSINLEHFNREIPRDLHQLVYCSSPDRGLHHLLDWFPDIRKRVPDARLNIYYKFQPWINAFFNVPIDPNSRCMTAIGIRARYITEALNRLGTIGENGVRLVGPVANLQMALELKSAGVLAYPCDTVKYTEGFGVAILDACAAGCVPIISDQDALGDVYGGVAEVIHGKPKREEWIERIVQAMTDPLFAATVTKRTKEYAQIFSRQRSGKRWEDMLARRLHA